MTPPDPKVDVEGMRERIARIIEPGAYDEHVFARGTPERILDASRRLRVRSQAEAIAKADAILSLLDAARAEGLSLLVGDGGGSSLAESAAAGPSDCAATAPSCQSEGDNYPTIGEGLPDPLQSHVQYIAAALSWYDGGPASQDVRLAWDFIIEALRTSAGWASLIAAEFAKPQFMTSTADSGRHWITFRFDSDDARERCHALEDAFRAAGRAINGDAQ